MSYFADNEFKCRCGCGMDVIDELKDKANEARGIAGVPFRITSGARCLRHNTRIGSKPSSSHVKGKAMDIAFRNSREKFLIIKGLILAGVDRIGINDKKNFIHADIDEDKPEEVMFKY